MEGELLLERRFPARADELEAVRQAVRGVADACRCDSECASDIVLAVDEACQNIIRHAYGGEEGVIVLRIARRGGELRISLRDFAACVDPDAVQPRDLARDPADLRPGGLGTHLIREVMDEVVLAPTGGVRGNELRMVKRIG